MIDSELDRENHSLMTATTIWMRLKPFSIRNDSESD
jgi:hypothetical protein